MLFFLNSKHLSFNVISFFFCCCIFELLTALFVSVLQTNLIFQAELAGHIRRSSNDASLYAPCCDTHHERIGYLSPRDGQLCLLYFFCADAFFQTLLHLRCNTWRLNLFLDVLDLTIQRQPLGVVAQPLIGNRNQALLDTLLQEPERSVCCDFVKDIFCLQQNTLFCGDSTPQKSLTTTPCQGLETHGLADGVSGT